MNVVYPLAVQLDYTELKYSLRSIEKFLPSPEVIIIGDHLPDWINNVTAIKLSDVIGRPMISVRRKVLAALNYADEFLFMNDDFYLLENYTPAYYSSGSLRGKSESGARPLLDQLSKIGKPISYYGHYPAIYKQDFTSIIEHFTDDCITKSAYLNFVGVNSVEAPDCKIMKPLKLSEIKEFVKGKPCFSTGMQSINSVLPILSELFPEPSKYEI